MRPGLPTGGGPVREAPIAGLLLRGYPQMLSDRYSQRPTAHRAHQASSTGTGPGTLRGIPPPPFRDPTGGWIRAETGGRPPSETPITRRHLEAKPTSCTGDRHKVALTIWDIKAFARTAVSRGLRRHLRWVLEPLWRPRSRYSAGFLGGGSRGVDTPLGIRSSFPSSLIYPGAHFCGAPRRPGFVGA